MGTKAEQQTNDRAGLLIVDKPAGLTSHDVVSRVRRLAQTRRVGHAGTLDPLATGVLVLGVNRATKLLAFITGADKTYQATIRLGISTDTDDSEGQIVTANGCDALGIEILDAAIEAFRGDIQQVPATVSAIKIKGERAYNLARQGREVNLPARPVTVHRFEIVGVPQLRQTDAGISVVDVEVEVDCTSGTYIRSLARDLGNSLGVGGHLTALRRTRVGHWTLEQASALESLDSESLPLLNLGDVCAQMYPHLEVDATQAAAFRHGQVPNIAVPTSAKDGQIYALAASHTPEAKFIGLVRWSDGKLGTALVNNPV